MYQSYLLRMWRDDHQGTWRASLQSTVTEQIYRFPSLEDLLAFLIAQTAVEEDDTDEARR